MSLLKKSYSSFTAYTLDNTCITKHKIDIKTRQKHRYNTIPLLGSIFFPHNYTVVHLFLIVDVSRSATQAQSVNLIPSVLGEGESVTQARGCLRHGAGRGWEVTLYYSLPSSFASRLITHNGNIYRLLTPTAACLYHDRNILISQKTIDSIRPTANSLTAHLQSEKEQKRAMQDSALS